MGRSSGQRVHVHNCTSFMLHRHDVRAVCGESWHHPTEIPPKVNRDNPKLISKVCHTNTIMVFLVFTVPYTYRIMETPDTSDHSIRWLLRIYSISANDMKNACFAAQVLKSDTSGPGTTGISDNLRAQLSWRDTTKHHDSNPSPDNDG